MDVRNKLFIFICVGLSSSLCFAMDECKETYKPKVNSLLGRPNTELYGLLNDVLISKVRTCSAKKCHSLAADHVEDELQDLKIDTVNRMPPAPARLRSALTKLLPFFSSELLKLITDYYAVPFKGEFVGSIDFTGKDVGHPELSESLRSDIGNVCVLDHTKLVMSEILSPKRLWEQADLDGYALQTVKQIIEQSSVLLIVVDLKLHEFRSLPVSGKIWEILILDHNTVVVRYHNDDDKIEVIDINKAVWHHVFKDKFCSGDFQKISKTLFTARTSHHDSSSFSTHLYDIKTGTVSDLPSDIGQFCVVPHTSRIAFTENKFKGRLRFWNYRTRKDEPEKTINLCECIAFSIKALSKDIILGVEYEYAFVCNLKTGVIRKYMFDKQTHGLFRLHAMPNGCCALEEPDGVIIMDPASGEMKRIRSGGSTCCVLPDGEVLVSRKHDNNVWDVWH